MSNKIDDFRAKRLLASNILFRCGYTILKIFLNIYLFKLTNDIKIVALFNIIQLTSFIISYDFLAVIIKNKFREFFYTLGLIGMAFVSLLVMIVGIKMPEYYVYIAVIFGIFNGMYWICYNNDEFMFTKIENRGNFQGLKSSLKTLVAIIIPAFAGSIIGINYFGFGYGIVFGFGVFFFILAAIIGFQKVEYATEERFNIRKGMKKIFGDKNMGKININQGLMEFGISTSLIDVLLPVLLFSYGLKEVDLGFLIAIFSILSVIATYVFGKFVKYSKYKVAYNVLSGIYIFSILILLIFPSLWYITVFSSIANMVFRIIYIPQNVYSQNTLNGISGHKNIITEQMVIMETITTISKIFTFILIYFIGTFSTIGIKILFGMLAFMMILSIFLFNSIKIPHKN